MNGCGISNFQKVKEAEIFSFDAARPEKSLKIWPFFKNVKTKTLTFE